MATLSQIAEQYGVSKSTARRWVAEFVPDALGNGRRADLTEAQLHTLAAGIAASGGSREPKISKEGVMRIDTDNRADENGRIKALETEVAELRAMNSSLERLNSSLERHNEQLLERLEYLEKALEREQMQARGFWSRLGQKLLGEGGKK